MRLSVKRCRVLTLTHYSLAALTSAGFVTISFNDVLTHIDGLVALTSAWLGVNIESNNALTNIDGLAALTSVGDLSTVGNDALTNIDGLAALTSVGGSRGLGNLRIRENDALTNIDGLAALTLVEGNLDIIANDDLSQFCGLFPLLDSERVGDAVVGGAITISDNGIDVTVADILASGFCPVTSANHLIADVAALNLPTSLTNHLLSKLDGAIAILDDGNPNNDGMAANKLGAFIKEVEAKRGHEIDKADADSLIDVALNIIDPIF